MKKPSKRELKKADPNLYKYAHFPIQFDKNANLTPLQTLQSWTKGLSMSNVYIWHSLGKPLGLMESYPAGELLKDCKTKDWEHCYVEFQRPESLDYINSFIPEFHRWAIDYYFKEFCRENLSELASRILTQNITKIVTLLRENKNRNLQPGDIEPRFFSILGSGFKKMKFEPVKEAIFFKKSEVDGQEIFEDWTQFRNEFWKIHDPLIECLERIFLSQEIFRIDPKKKQEFEIWLEKGLEYFLPTSGYLEMSDETKLVLLKRALKGKVTRKKRAKDPSI